MSFRVCPECSAPLDTGGKCARKCFLFRRTVAPPSDVPFHPLKGTVVIGKHRCVYCGQDHNAASNLKGARPKPGDISLCSGCEGINIFDEKLQLRIPTDGELEELRSDPSVAEELLLRQKQLKDILKQSKRLD